MPIASVPLPLVLGAFTCQRQAIAITIGIGGNLQLPWCSGCDRFWCRCSPYFASRPLSGPRSIWLSNIAIVSRLHGLGITSWDTRVAVGTLRGSERGGSIIPPRDASGRVVADLSATWEKRAWRDEFPRTCADRQHHLELHPIGRSERGGMRVPRTCREWRGLADLSATWENER